MVFTEPVRCGISSKRARCRGVLNPSCQSILLLHLSTHLAKPTCPWFNLTLCGMHQPYHHQHHHVTSSQVKHITSTRKGGEGRDIWGYQPECRFHSLVSNLETMHNIQSVACLPAPPSPSRSGQSAHWHSTPHTPCSSARPSARPHMSRFDAILHLTYTIYLT